ncbi:MAG TPA: hypothetical protein PLM56_02615 [Cyclobacteriaceae bacterium]|nr:hypothetical protein [Cyclobacteriaceae bacterium]HRF32366.1 hypothetical protein [Cyclobacteriaceae bacterium]
MFNTITWEQFLTTAALIIGGYYLITSVFFYHREIFGWLTNKSKSPLPTTEREPAANLMGKVQPEPVRPIRKQTVEADQIQFASGTPDEESEAATSDTKMVTGLVTDLLGEIKILGEMIVENKSPLEEGIALFKSLLEHYPSVRDSPFREAVTIVVHTTCKETCRYDLELTEVKTWWNTSH